MLTGVNNSDHLENLGIDGMIIVKLILQIQGWRIWIGFIWLNFGISVSGSGVLRASQLQDTLYKLIDCENWILKKNYSQ
jgi:hypothetical protein